MDDEIIIVDNGAGSVKMEMHGEMDTARGAQD